MLNCFKVRIFKELTFLMRVFSILGNYFIYMKYISLLFLLLVTVFSSNAQQFDNSFNSTGYNHIKHKPSTSSDIFNAFDFMSDGSIIVASGSSENIGLFYYNKFPLYKFNTNGTLDNTFQNNGVREIKYSDSCNSFFYALKVANNNKIIALVRADSTKFKATPNAVYVRFNYLIRLNANGTNDNTFGNNGRVIIDSAEWNYSGQNYDNLIVLNDGSVIVAFAKRVGVSSSDIEIHKYTSTGNLDPAFGTNGKIKFGYNDIDQPKSIIVQNNGKILVSGAAYNPLNSSPNTLTDLFVARLNANGTLDNTFGINGIISHTVGLYNDRVMSIGLGDSSSIYLSGHYQLHPIGHPNDKDWAIFLMKLDSTGNKVASFGANGTVSLNIAPDSDNAFDMKLKNNGIFIGGRTTNGTQNTSAVLIKFLMNGTLDNTFGTNGIRTFNTGASVQEHIESLAFQQDGKLVACGGNYICLSGTTCDRGSIYRFNNILTDINSSLYNNLNTRVFPNPANYFVTINNDNAIINLIRIYNIRGALIKENKLETNSAKINVSLLEKNIYILEIYSSDKVERRKLVIE